MPNNIKNYAVKSKKKGVEYTIPYRTALIENLGSFNFASTSSITTQRSKTILAKEPKTIKWIQSFKQNCTFIDIGANIGIYSIIAAKLKNANVYAFEPHVFNYAELYKNILINNLMHKIIGYNLALSNETEISKLFISSMTPGESHHDFSENRIVTQPSIGTKNAIQYFGNEIRDNRLTQGCAGFTLDYLLKTQVFPCPNHIKIDVDGFEWKVIDGMTNIINNSNVESILIEIDDHPKNTKILKIMEDAGWSYNQDECYDLSDYETNYIFRK